MPSVFFMAIATGLATSPAWLSISWGTYGLINGFNMDGKTAGLIVAIMWAIPVALCFSNGWVVNKLLKGNVRAGLALGAIIGSIGYLIASFYAPNYLVFAILVIGMSQSGAVFYWGSINGYWSGLARPEVAGTLNGLGNSMMSCFGFILLALSGGWVNESVQGVHSLSKLWLIGGIVYLISLIFIFISKDVTIGSSTPDKEEAEKPAI